MKPASHFQSWWLFGNW